MLKNCIYLDTYVLQKDMRIRLPKNVLANMPVEKGITEFEIYFEKNEELIILKPKINKKENN